MLSSMLQAPVRAGGSKASVMYINRMYVCMLISMCIHTYIHDAEPMY